MICTCRTGVVRNSPSNPYKAKETLERLSFETLYFSNSFSDKIINAISPGC